MTGTNHGITGAMIALTVKEPLLAVPVSLISHFVCDALPHFGVKDEPKEGRSEVFSLKFNIILITDFLVAVGLMALFGYWFPEQKWLIWACMVTAAAPDLANIYTRIYLERVKGRIYDPSKYWTSRIQWSSTYWGAFPELAWFLIMGWIIIQHRS